MFQEIMSLALNNGLWAALFCLLFLYQLKDSRAREKKYSATIESLSISLLSVKEIKAGCTRMSVVLDSVKEDCEQLKAGAMGKTTARGGSEIKGSAVENEAVKNTKIKTTIAKGSEVKAATKNSAVKASAIKTAIAKGSEVKAATKNSAVRASAINASAVKGVVIFKRIAGVKNACAEESYEL